MVKGGGKARATGECEANSKFTIPGVEGTFCKKCSEMGEAPIDGTCKAPTAGTDHCTSDSKGACTDCNKAASGGRDASANNYFLFEGGCYNKDSSPGNKLCSTVTSGACSAVPTTDAITFIKDSTLYLCSDATNGEPGCSTCTYDSTKTPTFNCNSCLDGFYPNTTTSPVNCTACTIKDCKTCSSSACSECASGFGPVYDSSLVITNCTSCPTDCTECADQGFSTICEKCGTGKVPIDGNCSTNSNVCTAPTTPDGTCSSCKNGFLFYQGGCLSPQKAADLKVCALGSQLLVGNTTVCTECKGGFVPIDGECLPIKQINNGTTRAGQDICLDEKGNKVSDTATKCGACISTAVNTNNYFLFNGGCYPISAAGSSSSSSVGSLLCSSASKGKCTAAATNAPFILDASSGAFTACPKECGACTSSTVCSSCALGYYSNSTVTGPSNCTACPSGCTSCPNGTCALCWDGSTPTKDACPSPPSSSSSGLSGGAIAGIVIAVLLVLGGLGGFLGWWFGCRGK
ncbi:pVSP [Giardia muris]|uniref:PVSP n=1 Tax=Giardia muris TaxID=5742 RepID=A0A4Z1T4Z7_GIAMU|nr:pVSP [Giardia muris]|eukprot:TNJ30748.1 pVSP [Giardia muris]